MASTEQGRSRRQIDMLWKNAIFSRLFGFSSDDDSEQEEPIKVEEQGEKKETIGHTKQNEKLGTNRDTPIFEIFGIKLYFDDILLIALIFFLYNEGVEDNFLFISLILLLLS